MSASIFLGSLLTLAGLPLLALAVLHAVTGSVALSVIAMAAGVVLISIGLYMAERG